MKVQSTGLGKMVLESNFIHFKPENERGGVKVLGMEMGIEATDPVHWTIKVHLEPKDLLEAAGLAFKPKVLGRLLHMLFAAIFSRKTKNSKSQGNVNT
jgi:hypothetical protein